MTDPVRHTDVVCPFCALGSDDLTMEAEGASLRLVGDVVCCRSEFERPLGQDSPRIAGQPASLEAACARAAELLAASHAPLLAGLGTDTDGLRAALLLAERVGATVDHMHGSPLLANIHVMQTGGWVTGTLAELRVRPELVLCFGTDASALMPRFFERVVWPAPRPAAAPAARRLVLLGEGLDAARAGAPADAWPEAPEPRVIPCATAALPEIAAALRALVAGQRLNAATVGGVPLATLSALAAELRDAAYSAILWAAGELPEAGADLAISSLAEMLKSLNQTTRAVGLPLAAGNNALGANQVVAWSWGVPLRSSVAGGHPVHLTPGRAGGRLLADGAVDLRLWISSFATDAPPPAAVPTIALVRSGTAFATEPEVVIPVGTPGLDHAGSVFRTDAVVALPLRQLRDAGPPSVADLLARITAQLPFREAA